MSEIDKFLVGALKLTRQADSIGLPVFMGRGGNAMYVPEMDADFLISDFLNFTNPDGLIIDDNVPGSHAKLIYKVNDPTPIPYWLRGKCYVVSGSAEASDLEHIHGSEVESVQVLQMLWQYLADARNGVFHVEREGWVAREISVIFDDVFHETPVHSIYWVRRFEEAVKHARTIAQPPHRIDEELRRVGLEWIRRFATKTDIARMTSIVGSLVNSKALSVDRARSAYFGFVMHRIQSGKFKEVEREILSNNEFKALFPYGIYTFYKEHDWSAAPFDYARPYAVLDPLFKELRSAESTDDYARLEMLAYVYFLRSDAPKEVRDAIRPILDTLNDNFLEIIARLYKKKEIDAEFYQDAVKAVSIYRSMQQLEGCMLGVYRLSKEIYHDRFGANTRFVQLLISVAEDAQK